MPEYKNITALKKQISDVKRTIESPNSDYLTGYISALSVTEGMIEEIPTANVVEIPDKGIGELSDGYHTFNELYHHRAVLFSAICNSNPSRAWKSKLHDTGDMYDGMFIVGIETPQGQATYHYDIEPYWDLFKVKELEKAPKWDGHTPQQAIDRISSLNADAIGVRCKDCEHNVFEQANQIIHCNRTGKTEFRECDDFCKHGKRKGDYYEREIDMRDSFAKKVCNATQKTNYACNLKCKGEGNCAYCLVMAEDMIANGVIVPPVKPGDTVYAYCEYFGVLQYLVGNFHIGYMGKEDYLHWEAAAYATETDELLDEMDFDLDDIGKTVFLTREEAERALEART